MDDSPCRADLLPRCVLYNDMLIIVLDGLKPFDRSFLIIPQDRSEGRGESGNGVEISPSSRGISVVGLPRTAMIARFLIRSRSIASYLV